MVVISENEYLNLKKMASAKNSATTDEASIEEEGEKEEINHNDLLENKTHQIKTNDQNEEYDNMRKLLQRVTEYLSGKESEKATLLIKRVYASGKMKISTSEEKVELGNDNYSFNQFIDFIQLCISRKRPHESTFLKKFVIFLADNEIPLNIISNGYMKTMIKTQIRSDTDIETEGVSSHSKPLHIIWYKTLDEVK